MLGPARISFRDLVGTIWLDVTGIEIRNSTIKVANVDFLQTLKLF